MFHHYYQGDIAEFLKNDFKANLFSDVLRLSIKVFDHCIKLLLVRMPHINSQNGLTGMTLTEFG